MSATKPYPPPSHVFKRGIEESARRDQQQLLRQQARSSSEIQVIREAIYARLESLWRDHRNLEIALTALLDWSPLSDTQIRELKKRKLAIKDAIACLHSAIQPISLKANSDGV